MDKHALAILGQDNFWNWSNTKQIQESGGKLESITHKFLYYLILESQTFGGDVLDLFWTRLAECNIRFGENIELLKEYEFESAEKTSEVLFRGPIPKNVLCYVWRRSTLPISVLFLWIREGDNLERIPTFPYHPPIITVYRTEQSFKRDDTICLLTHRTFRPFDPSGIRPALTHIISHSVQGKPDTLNCIAMFAGAAARDDVIHNLNSISNVMNMQQDTHSDYDDLMWGIEAKEQGRQVKYFFRMIPSVPKKVGQGLIALTEGDEIQFGGGLKSEQLNKGPIPRLCNLRLAVARVLKMSGAADIIFEWKDQADDDGISCFRIASDEFCVPNSISLVRLSLHSFLCPISISLRQCWFLWCQRPIFLLLNYSL